MVRRDYRNIDAKRPADDDKDLFITVFTDASYCPHTKAFGCAYWLRDGQEGKHSHSWGGPWAQSAEDAETRALKGAMEYIQNNCLTLDRVIVIQSDCLNALNKLDRRGFQERCFAKFVKLKHVKAHTGHGTKRTWVNNWCDEQAKREMLKFREQANATT